MKKVLAILKNVFFAILKGELILRLRVEKYISQIIYTFILIGTVIWLSIVIDNSLVRVENNGKAISELEKEYSEICFEKAASESRTAVSERLRRMGSKLAEPEKAATIVLK